MRAFFTKPAVPCGLSLPLTQVKFGSAFSHSVLLSLLELSHWGEYKGINLIAEEDVTLVVYFLMG